MSFLELLDVVNEDLLADGKEPIAFDHDCREGICGSCSMMINGQAHGPERGTATCQLHLRKLEATATDVTIEPWRAARFPIIKDLSSTAPRSTASSNRAATSPRRPDRLPTATSFRCRRKSPTSSMDAAACIGCGACVAACPNGAAQLFTAAKLSHLNLMPQGQAERCDAHGRDGRHDGDLLRIVHESPGVRGRVPEVDLHRLHRADEPRLREGATEEPAPRGPDLPVAFRR